MSTSSLIGGPSADAISGLAVEDPGFAQAVQHLLSDLAAGRVLYVDAVAEHDRAVLWIAGHDGTLREEFGELSPHNLPVYRALQHPLNLPDPPAPGEPTIEAFRVAAGPAKPQHLQ